MAESAHFSAQTQQLYQRLEDMRDMLQTAAPYFPDQVRERALADLEKVEKRLHIGGNFAVAALVGGTGSGKSTFFNALTGLEFADAGELRPTTERPTACAWSEEAVELLDYLEIERSRRIVHDSILTPTPAELEGLVLLDLPDHDSVKIGHSLLVGKILPLVDVLIWVVDPQKYADHLLHREYLEALADRADSMLVVLNQVDTLPAGGADRIIEDLRGLLIEDGLKDVPIYPVSALQGQGLEPVKAILQAAVQRPNITQMTAEAELAAISARLRVYVGEGEAELRGAPTADFAEKIFRASGLPSVVQSIHDSGKGWFRPAVSAPDRPSHTMTVAIRDAWEAHLVAGMPDLWEQALCRALPTPERMRKNYGLRLAKVPAKPVAHYPRWIFTLFAALLFAGGIAGAVLGIPWAGEPPRIALLVAASLGAFLLFRIGKYWLEYSAQRAAARYEARIQAEINSALEADLIAEPEKILALHRRAREILC